MLSPYDKFPLRFRHERAGSPAQPKKSRRIDGWFIAREFFQNVYVRFRRYSSIAFAECNARIAMQFSLCNPAPFTRMRKTPLYYLAIVKLQLETFQTRPLFGAPIVGKH
jgi:hypothetical protein